MIGLFVTICPILISGNSLSDNGEFCFRFQVFLLYATQLITNTLAACLIYTVYLLADVCVGIPLLGYFSLFERGRLITLIGCSYLLMLSWTAILTMIAILISNRMISLILCICAVLAVLCFGLYQLNVMTDAVFLYAYSESRQNVTLFLADFLPGSQMMELFAMSDHLGNLLPRVMTCGSVLWGIVSTTAGLLLFSKKDLK